MINTQRDPDTGLSHTTYRSEGDGTSSVDAPYHATS